MPDVSIYGSEVSEESLYLEPSHLITPTIFPEFVAITPESSLLAAIDLTGTEYVWMEMEEPDLSIEIDFLNQKLKEKELIIEELERQIDVYINEIDDFKREFSGFEKLNHKIKNKDEVISKLNKEISAYKERLDRFTIDFSLPEGYYGNEEYNE